MKIAGLDIGTTGCKITVFDEKGNNYGKEYSDYPVTRSGVHEVDANAIVAAIFSVLSEAAKKYPDIAGIGITSFGESFVLTDCNGKSLMPVMLYTDPRGQEECKELVNSLGKENISRTTGTVPHEMYSLPKLMWAKRHQAEIFERAKYVFLIQDYVSFLLTGERKIDYSLATRTLAFDVKTLDWNINLLSAAGITKDMLSKPVPTGTVVGKLKEEVCKRTGLNAKCIVVTAGHDQVAAAVGAGVFEECIGVDGAGTVECITPVFGTIPKNSTHFNNNYNIVPYFGKYVCYAFSYTGGALIQWCADTVLKIEKQIAEENGISVHQYIQKEYKDPTGILVLPHLAGAATPYMDTASKGAIVGLTMATTATELYPACMEGVAFEMRLNIEKLKESGINIQKLVATGGGAKSSVWMQIKANVLNLPIEALQTEEAGTTGSAMLTGIAVKAFNNMNQAKQIMIKRVAVYKPDTEKVKVYNSIYRRYERLYDVVRPLV